MKGQKGKEKTRTGDVLRCPQAVPSPGRDYIFFCLVVYLHDTAELPCLPCLGRFFSLRVIAHAA